MRVLTTPGERFAGLDWPAPTMVPTATPGLEVAVVELGDPTGPTVLCLHGEPSWSWLWRDVARPLAAAGLHVVVPDLVGFGRSGKPSEVADHTYAQHVEWLSTVLVEGLDLHGVTLVCQDWGGLLGLRLVAQHAERFTGVVAANTGLPDGSRRMPDIWWRFKQVVDSAPTLDVGQLVQAGVARTLSPAEVAAYDAPFPSEELKAGPRAMPGLVPNDPDDPGAVGNRAAWAVLERLELPVVTAFSDRDPITGGGDVLLQRRLPGAEGQPHVTLAGGHFLQEDSPADLAAVALDLVRRTRT